MTYYKRCKVILGAAGTFLSGIKMGSLGFVACISLGEVFAAAGGHERTEWVDRPAYHPTSLTSMTFVCAW